MARIACCGLRRRHLRLCGQRADHSRATCDGIPDASANDHGFLHLGNYRSDQHNHNDSGCG
jgi:hypothetical protein